jgi:glycolate oxidase iron-sulfur subunit
LSLVISARDLGACVHCGLCLQHCPTYLATGREAESPRGRLHLIGALADGRIGPTEAYARHLDLCLGCRACESACPSGVRFGHILELARAQLVEPQAQAGRPATRPRRLGLAWARAVRWLVFEQLVPRPNRLLLLARLLRFYQRSGMRRIVRAVGVSRLTPALERAEAQLPPLANRFFRPGGRLPPRSGAKSLRVGLFLGCVTPFLYPDLHAATVRLLRRAGCEVVVPDGQTCCGALNLHGGERRVAGTMARQNVRAFLRADLDAIVVNAAGCGAALKEYRGLLTPEEAGTSVEQASVARFSALVHDVSELLVKLELPPPEQPLKRRVTIQDSCHLVHAQRIREAPRSLLRAVPGLELVELPHADTCCGGAGVYNLTQPAMSERILDAKLAEVAASGADTVVTANPGCMLQLERGLRDRGRPTSVKHLVHILDEAYR